MKDQIKKLLQQEAEAILNIPVEEGFEKAVELIYQCVHKNGGRVIASGMGKAGKVADNIATTLSSTGTPATFLHPAEAQHGDLGLIKENDILIVLSNSGKTREILELVNLTHNLYSNIPVIVITGNPEGELPKTCDAVIY
ncbi:MAG: SIS domain-containing protein, partial [Bacteroidales bacterium]